MAREIPYSHWPAWTICPCSECWIPGWLTSTQITRTDCGERSIQRKIQMLSQIKRATDTAWIWHAKQHPERHQHHSHHRDRVTVSHLCVPVTHSSPRGFFHDHSVPRRLLALRQVLWEPEALLLACPPEIVQSLPSSFLCILRWTCPSHGLCSHLHQTPAFTLLISS